LQEDIYHSATIELLKTGGWIVTQT
jgi:hypothetical protein